MYMYRYGICARGTFLLHMQAFCTKAKSMISSEAREAQQLSPFHVNNENSFFIANVEQVNEIDFSGSNLVFVNLMNVSNVQLCII